MRNSAIPVRLVTACLTFSLCCSCAQHESRSRYVSRDPQHLQTSRTTAQGIGLGALLGAIIGALFGAASGHEGERLAGDIAIGTVGGGHLGDQYAQSVIRKRQHYANADAYLEAQIAATRAHSQELAAYRSGLSHRLRASQARTASLDRERRSAAGKKTEAQANIARAEQALASAKSEGANSQQCAALRQEIQIYRQESDELDYVIRKTIPTRRTGSPDS